MRSIKINSMTTHSIKSSQIVLAFVVVLVYNFSLRVIPVGG